MRRQRTRLFGILLGLALVLVTGMRVSAYAATDTYTNLMNNRTLVTFNGIPWYIIEDKSNSLSDGTLTLLQRNRLAGGRFS